MKSLISAENTWVLMGIITGCTALSIYLEQKYIWASRISGVIIALILGMALTNFGVIPIEAPAYDLVWNYAVPLSLPLLLMQCNIGKIRKESGKMFFIFLIGSVGSSMGAIIGFILLNKYIPGLAQVAGAMTGSYIGGSINLAALSGIFDIPREMLSALTVADNLLMTVYFFVLIAIPSIGFFKMNYAHPHMDKQDTSVKAEDTKDYWGGKEISIRDIACAFATGFIIVAISGEIAEFMSQVIPQSNIVLSMLNAMLGNRYMIITTIAVACATFFPKVFSKIRGTQEIGTYLIYLFFFVIGVPASITMILKESPLLLLFCAIMVLINMLFVFVFGKIFKLNLEDIILASNANIGGPTTAVAMAISKGWVDLVAPTMLVGTLGYVIGNYFGIFIGTLLM